MRKSLSVFALTGFFLLVPCPEGGKLLLQLCGAAQVLELVPVAGEQAGVFTAGKAVIQQKHYTSVFLRADDPARRLQHLVHAWEAVGVVETSAARLVIVAAQDLLPGGSPEAGPPPRWRTR